MLPLGVVAMGLSFSLALRSWKKVQVLVTQLCLTLCDPMDCSPPGSSVHGILQARILEWIAICFSRGSYWLRDWTQVSCIAGKLFTVWATRESLRSWTGPENSWLYTNSQIYSTAIDGTSGKDAAYQCWRQGFRPWVGKIPWRRAWQPTPVFLPGESHGQRSLVGYSAQGHKESDTTEANYRAYLPSTFAKMWKSRSQRSTILEHGRMVS